MYLEKICHALVSPLKMIPPNDMDMIARNPKNHTDKWYVASKYFEDNLEPVRKK